MSLAIMNQMAINIPLQVFCDLCFHFSSVNEQNCWVIGQLYVYFYKKLSDLFLSGWKPQFPTTMYENYCCSTSFSTFNGVNLLNSGNCTEWIAISYCNLNLHFLDDSWYWILFNGLISHLYIFFCEVSGQIFCLF